MELEVGMYARYNGRIGKIKYICDCEQCKARGYLEPVIEYIHKEDEYVSCYYKNDLKASHNIIDLIEVGDYVNGSKVIDISIIGKDKEKWVWVEQMEDTDNKYGDDYVGYNNEQIKSIVTKEQFESMSYKVGDNK